MAAVPGARAAEQARGHTRSIPKDDDVSRVPLSRPPRAPGLQMFSSRRRRPIWWRGGSENRAAVGHRSRAPYHARHAAVPDPAGLQEGWHKCERSSGALVHGLRHTFATELANANVSVYTLMKLLGHESMVTSQRYVDGAGIDTRAAAEQNPLYGLLSTQRRDS